MDEPSTLIFSVNGKKITDDSVDPECTLLQYIRKSLRLTGTKNGCSEGGCGACTVMVSRYNREKNQVLHYSLNACLAPVCCLHGAAVTTVEGIGSVDTKLHPVQERIAKSHGSQCGFCTPGFVMSMYTLLRNNPTPTMEEIEDNLIGNLCRCTGYRPILEGYKSFSSDAAGGCGRRDCCRLQNGTNGEINGMSDEQFKKTEILFDPESFDDHDPSQDIIFPPELKLLDLDKESLQFRGRRVAFYRPTVLSKLLKLKSKYPNARLIGGNTEIGVETEFKNQVYPVLIDISKVAELQELTVTESGLRIGASVPLSDIEAKLKCLIESEQEHKTRVFKEMLEMLHWFAGRQIRNVATLGGNIMTGSPISDLNPILMAGNAVLTFDSVDGERKLTMDHNFYTGYRRNVSKPSEILVSVDIPFTEKNEYFAAYKQARRREDDIAIVNSAFRVKFDPGTQIVSDVWMAYGGMAPTSIMPLKTMKLLKGRDWSELLHDGMNSLLEEIKLDPSAPGGMVEYRRSLTISFFFKFHLRIRQQLNGLKLDAKPLSKGEIEANKPFEIPPPASMQLFQTVPRTQEPIDPIGRPIQTVSSYMQTTGEAVYVDDIPEFSNELHAALVISTHAYAKIVKIDESKALEISGVEGFFSAKDLPPERNIAGPTRLKDEEIFASTHVHTVGQIIGVVLATSLSIAKEGAKCVKVEYEDMPNPILTIEDAIKSSSFYEPFSVRKGNLDEGFKMSDHVLEGQFYTGGQEHFYMETNSHIAIHRDKDEMELISTTQNPTSSQIQVARALGVHFHKVTCKVKRLGGGFGGKETRTEVLAAVAAIAAKKTKKPVRIVLNRHEDMQITGNRHPMLAKWKIGFTKNGRVTALDCNIYSNAGWCMDLSRAVAEKAVFNVENTYNFPHARVTGRCCKTNLPSNTAFRAFGTIQGILFCEDMISKVADYLHCEPKRIQELNFYADGDLNLLGSPMKNITVKRCWEEVLLSSGYEARRKKIHNFNKVNRFKKRGISINPAKFGISFSCTFLNQSGALVHVYMDGSVLVSHGGVEMGQGLHTKMIQVASRELKIPVERIHIAETATDKVPNTPPTAASVSSDLNGMAVIDACNKINESLAPYKKKNPNGKWEDWVMSAYLDRSPLFASGFYATPIIEDFNFETQKGNFVNYYVYGAAVSEVEIECLTGDHWVLKTDIVMDIGNSLNPAIDIGQIEGAFAQGIGLVTIEELKFSPDGTLLTKGPGAYKIPGSMNIPREFNVSLLRDSSNPRAVYSSKAVGEPPLCLATSVFFAIKEAVKDYRRDNKRTDSFEFNSPATAEAIRMACEDQFTDKIQKDKGGTFKPWSITAWK